MGTSYNKERCVKNSNLECFTTKNHAIITIPKHQSYLTIIVYVMTYDNVTSYYIPFCCIFQALTCRNIYDLLRWLKWDFFMCANKCTNLENNDHKKGIVIRYMALSFRKLIIFYNLFVCNAGILCLLAGAWKENTNGWNWMDYFAHFGSKE